MLPGVWLDEPIEAVVKSYGVLIKPTSLSQKLRGIVEKRLSYEELDDFTARGNVRQSTHWQAGGFARIVRRRRALSLERGDDDDVRRANPRHSCFEQGTGIL